MEPKSKSQMRRLKAQLPDYKALMRVVRAANGFAPFVCDYCSENVGELMEALEALPEHLKETT